MAPNSPKARAKRERFQQFQDSGRMTRQNTVASDAPRVRGRNSIDLFKAPCAVLYISGKATTVAVITVAGQEKTTVNWQ